MTKSSNHTPGGAESGALAFETPTIDSDLAAIIDAWPKLSEPLRAAILAMVRAVGN